MNHFQVGLKTNKQKKPLKVPKVIEPVKILSMSRKSEANSKIKVKSLLNP